jgi:hypothetical protein
MHFSFFEAQVETSAMLPFPGLARARMLVARRINVQMWHFL